MNFLITGSGAPGSKGTLFCLREFTNSRFIGIDGDKSKQSISDAMFDEFIHVPRDAHNSNAFIERIINISIEKKIDIVLPQTTREIEIFSKHSDDFYKNNIKVAVSSYKSICNANSKYKVTNILKNLGYKVPIVKRISTKKELINNIELFEYPKKPVVIKAVNLNGKRGYRVINEGTQTYQSFINEKPSNDNISFKQLCDLMPEKFDDFLLMEFLEGEEYSVDAFIGAKTKIAIPRKREIIRSGISFSNTLEKDDDLINQTLDLGEALDINGVFGVQFIKNKNGESKILECNPRIQGTMVVAALSGANIIKMFINELMFKVSDHDYEIDWDTRFDRYWGGYGAINKKIIRI